MTDAVAPLSDLPTSAPDWARAMAERQLAALGELAELGLDLARAIGRQASAAADRDAAAELQGMGLAYARVARAVRLIIALQSKRMDDLLTHDAKAAEIDDEEQMAPYDLRKMRVERIVERVARSEHEAEDAVDALMIEAGDRLEDEDLYGDLLERPMSEIVARLCRDLNLSPDWSALSQELWAQDEIESGEGGEPLTSPIAPAMAGGGPRAERSEERVVEGAGGEHYAAASPSRDSS
jgi:hypothetical protein